MDVFDLFAKLSLDTSEYEKGIDSAKKSSGDLKKSLAVAGAATAGAGAAVFAFADKVSKNADEIDKMSQKLGLSAEAYQEWSYVLELNGTSIDKMQGGMKTLVNTLDDAKNGSADAIEKFERIGLSLEDIQDMSQEELFGAVVEQFQGMEDTAERAALANDLLGKSATELRPLFNSTTEATQEQIQALHDMGGVMSDQAVKDGAAFQDALTSLKKAFAGVANTLGEKLMPYITDLMDGITQFVADGGIEKIIKWFKRLAPVITAAASAMVAYKAASSIGAVIDALTKATKAQSAAQAILNTVMNANPFVLAATAIAGVTAALVTLYVTNEDFRNFVKACWEGIKDIIGGVINAIKYVIQGWIDLFKSIPDIFKFVGDKIGKFFDNIKNALSAIPKFFHEKFTKAKEAAVKAFSNVGKFFSDVWKNITSAFKNAVEWFKNLFANVWKAITTVFDKVGEFFAGVWNVITSAFKNAVEFYKNLFTNVWNAITAVFDKAGEFFTGVWNVITYPFKKAVEWYKKLFSMVWEAITLAFTGVGEFFLSVWEEIKAPFVAVKEWFVGIFQDAWDGVKSITDTLWNGAEGIFNIIKGAVEGIAGFFEDIGEGVVECWNTVTEWVGKIAEEFWGMIESALEWGAELAERFWEGVKSGAKNLYDVIMGNEEEHVAIESDRNLKGVGFRGRNVIQTANGASSDTNVTVYIGQEQVDDIVVNNEQRRNYRSGGR